MKFYIAVVCLLSIASFGFCQDIQKHEGNYGAAISAKGAFPAGKLPKKLNKEESVDATIKGEIIEVCQSKGCWMTIDMGNEEQLRVKFKDYGFFVPKGAAGKTAIIKGVANKEVVSVDEQKHLAKDAGKSESEINAITNPNQEYTFVAEGVIIL